MFISSVTDLQWSFHKLSCPKGGRGSFHRVQTTCSLMCGDGTEWFSSPLSLRKGHAFWEKMQTGTCWKCYSMEACLRFFQRLPHRYGSWTEKKGKDHLNKRVEYPMLWEFIILREFSTTSPAFRGRHEWWNEKPGML